VTAAATTRASAALPALARAAGVQRWYTDVRGRRRAATREALSATLRALGHDVGESGAGAAAALRALRGRRPPLSERVAVAWDGGGPVLELADTSGGGRVGWTARLEDGRELSGAGPADALVRTAAGRRLELPDLPPGYHDVHVELGGRESTTLVLAAPRRAHPGPARTWGVFLPLYAIPGPFGPGDFTLLRRLVDWTASRGGTVVGSTPLHAAFLDRPFDPSPYAPVSRLHWNELYVDPEAVPELEASADARRLLPPAAATGGGLVDYRAAMAAKRPVLEALAAALAGSRLEEFERHLRADPDLAAYAGFRARCEREGGGWRDWSGPEAGAGDGRAARYHAYVQWLCSDQLARARTGGAGVYLDMPLGVHPSGYDTWRFADAFAGGVSVGAPPDDFHPGGQDWGFPPLHPGRVRESGHAYPIACAATTMRHALAARIDHVMGLHRTYWVPHGFPATDGVYVHSPAEELYAVMCIESHRHRTMLVGEDLGTVPQGVRRAMSRHGLLRSYVVQAEAGSGTDPLERIPQGAMAGMNTHDMPTFAGFWDSPGRDDLRRVLRAAVSRRGHDAADGPAVLDGCLEELARSRVRCLLVNLEDMWWEREPQNVPGTGAERPNWRRRARHGVEELDTVPGLAERLGRIARLRAAAA
jgi:4-alpha-glucanotransferase